MFLLICIFVKRRIIKVNDGFSLDECGIDIDLSEETVLSGYFFNLFFLPVVIPDQIFTEL